MKISGVSTMTRVALATAALSAAIVPASAQTFFTDRAAFLAAAGGGLGFESFEAVFSVAPSVDFGAVTVTESGGTNGVAQARDFGFVAPFITEGTGAVWFDDNNNSLGTFTFDSPITAFGVDITSDTDTTIDISGPFASSINRTANTPAFFGVITDAPFSSITFAASGGPNYGWDNLRFGTAQVGGQAAPEPGALALLLVGGVVGVVYRRRS